MSIEDCPNEILEKIFFYLSPYADLINSMKVCKRWRQIGKSVLNFRQGRFQAGLEQSNTMIWTKLTSNTSILDGSMKTNVLSLTNVPSDRFGASLIYYDNVLFMFGGATMQRTTFNDLWTFDLTLRKWSRVLPSTGTYPPPRACAIGVRYHTNLVIYGGFEHQTTSLIWVRSHWLNTAYVYSVPDNRWTNLHLNPKDGHSGGSLPNSCGHSVCLLQRNRLLLFGGKCEDRRLNSVHLIDIGVGEWSAVDTSIGGNAQPAPRFGHTAVSLSEDKMLMLGGDIGPNSQANDVWMLQVDGERGNKWWWSPILMAQSNSVPPSLNYLSSVKVPGLDMVLILGSANPLLEDHLQSLHERASAAAREQGGLPFRNAQRRQSAPGPDSILQDQVILRAPSGTTGERSPLPAIRRNSRADRQRRLNALQAEEDRLREINRRGPQRFIPTNRKRPLCLYNLDVSDLLSSPPENTSSLCVKWTPLQPTNQNLEIAPAERFGYPVVIGRQEIYVMGGLVTRGERSRRRFFVDNLLIDPMMQAETDPQLFELSGDLFVCTPEIASRNLT